jgi:hypothetical protein
MTERLLGPMIIPENPPIQNEVKAPIAPPSPHFRPGWPSGMGSAHGRHLPHVYRRVPLFDRRA